ncbi:MAG TPA: AraC family transcriptional regulator [Blastocatellia bacterium]|nr:AraC family transcriptional regulator [Blastocatellia bacterium]
MSLSDVSGAARPCYLESGQFFGDIVHAQRRCGLLLSDARYAGGTKLPRHSHELAFFCLLLEGAYSESYGKRGVEYEPFTVVFHPPEEMHTTEMSRHGGRVFNIEVQGALLDRLRECAAVPDTVFDLHGGELVWLAAKLYREYRAMDACSPLVIEGLALEMLAIAARSGEAEAKRPPAWLSEVIDLLREEYRRSLSVSEVASKVGVHPFHLSRVFRRFHNLTVGEYVNQLRVHFACGELLKPEAELAQLALEAGFADQSHFTRVFKQVTGTTPGAFRDGMIKRKRGPAPGVYPVTPS